MSQINPFRAMVIPTAVPQRVKPEKDRQQRQREEPAHEQAEEQTEKPAEDGKPHIDLKA